MDGTPPLAVDGGATGAPGAPRAGRAASSSSCGLGGLNPGARGPSVVSEAGVLLVAKPRRAMSMIEGGVITVAMRQSPKAVGQPAMMLMPAGSDDALTTALSDSAKANSAMSLAAAAAKICPASVWVMVANVPAMVFH